jgi:hypothetical protein
MTRIADREDAADPRPAMRAKVNGSGIDPVLAERLLSRTEFDPKTGCLNWTGAVTADGYGSISWNGKTLYTHHLACELEHGARNDLYVLQACKQNRRCVSPEHLRLGTAAENNADAVADGTAGRPPGRVLSDRNICEVSGFLLLGLTAPQIKAETGVSLKTVGLVKKGAHRPDAASNELDRVTGAASDHRQRPKATGRH